MKCRNPLCTGAMELKRCFDAVEGTEWMPSDDKQALLEMLSGDIDTRKNKRNRRKRDRQKWEK